MGQSSFGEDLRRARELREIGLEEVAEATKVQLRYLEALEEDRFEDLPGGVFNLGFLRAYCEFVGMDSEAMVDAYRLEEQTRDRPAGSDKRLIRGATPPPPEPPFQARDAGARPIWLLAVVAIIAVTVTAFLIWSFVGVTSP